MYKSKLGYGIAWFAKTRRIKMENFKKKEEIAAESHMTKSIHNLLIALAIQITLVGCSSGIESKKPILLENESDIIVNANGYWKCIGKVGHERAELGPYLIEDNSTGFILKDRKYKLKPLFGKPEETYSFVVRAKKSDETYALQACSGEAEKFECVYAYMIRSNNGFNLYPTYDMNLSKVVKEVLADIYVNAENRNEIKLPNEFVNSKGKLFIESISKSQPKADLTDECFICEKISIDKARELVDKQRAEEERHKSEASAK
ncbi:MAG: hypothetical protein ACKN9T_14070 [Candidatus Methylumidiphilus sp.]